MVITDYQQPDLKLDLFGGASGTYAGLDRFGRTVDHRWYDYTSGTVDRARYYYGYDSNGNRQWQEDPVAAAAMVNLDILYAYDGLNRLTAYDRGDLNGGHTAITTLTFAQQWTLDQLNNWSGFDEDTDGDTTDDLVQARTHNDANEITAITASTGANWVDPTYDGAGNMITGPTPRAETATQKYVYDAWNRLVKVTDGSDATLATFGYDARGYRITKGVYAAGMLSQARHYYHTDQNQVVEERIDASTDPDRQYTWGSRYMDDLVMRTRDTDANGSSLDETLYALHDANWSITALADTSGTVVERFRYDAYGRAAVLDANFSADANGLSDYLWEYRFTSREWDAESGLHYFRARYYDDAGGRFLQRDALGYVDGLNQYAGYYIPDNVDPSGHDRDMFFFGHVWIVVDEWDANCQRTGRHFIVEFAPARMYDVIGGCCYIPPGTHYHVNRSTIYPSWFRIQHYSSNCQQDRALVQLFRELEDLRRSGDAPSYSVWYNCWVAAGQFARYGGSAGDIPVFDPPGNPTFDTMASERALCPSPDIHPIGTDPCRLPSPTRPRVFQ